MTEREPNSNINLPDNPGNSPPNPPTSIESGEVPNPSPVKPKKYTVRCNIGKVLPRGNPKGIHLVK